MNLPDQGQLTGAVVHETGDRRGKSYSDATSLRPAHWSFSRSRFTRTTKNYSPIKNSLSHATIKNNKSHSNPFIFLFSVETRLDVSRGASDNRHAVYPGARKIAGDRPQRVCQGLLLQVISIHAKVWFTRNVFLHRFSHRLKVG